MTLTIEVTSLQAHIIFEALHYPEGSINRQEALQPVVDAMEAAGVWDAPVPAGIFTTPLSKDQV